MSGPVQTAVMGVTGYAGAELARILLRHPRLKGTPPVFAGRLDEKAVERGGIPLGEIHPELVDSKGNGNLRLQQFSWDLLTDLDVQVLFLATPHEQSREWVPEALERGMRVIDLSGAWRLNEAANRAVYAFEDEGSQRAEETQQQAVYGMPELHRSEIREREVSCESGMLFDFSDSAAAAAGGRGLAGPGSRHRRGREERRERSGQGADGEDTLHVCGGQPFGLWSVYA